MHVRHLVFSAWMQSTPAGWVSQTFQVGMFTARSFEGGNCWVLGVGGFVNPIRLLTLTQFHRILCITCASGWQSKLTSWPWHWTWDLEISQGMRIFSSIFFGIWMAFRIPGLNLSGKDSSGNWFRVPISNKHEWINYIIYRSTQLLQ